MPLFPSFSSKNYYLFVLIFKRQFQICVCIWCEQPKKEAKYLPFVKIIHCSNHQKLADDLRSGV
uniref:Uncharacterized protein n=1 Tax=Piliocolobus tephrosceles TaxID=591936 RepID=A0A8C9I5I2_9PRIM